jgi:hypothetical protein
LSLADFIKEKRSLKEYSFSKDGLQAVIQKDKEDLKTDLSNCGLTPFPDKSGTDQTEMPGKTNQSIQEQ